MKQWECLILLTSILLFISCNNKAMEISEKDKIEWKVLDEKEYSISYPTSWELDQSGLHGSSFFLFSKLNSENDSFRENINLLIQNLSGLNMDLDKFANLSENQINAMVTNGKMIENERLKSKGIEFQKMIYTSEQNNRQLQFEQYYWVKDDQAYILTFTAEENQFYAYQKLVEKILDSFKLK